MNLNCFENYSLSVESKDQLKNYKILFKQDIKTFDFNWGRLFKKEEEEEEIDNSQINIRGEDEDLSMSNIQAKDDYSIMQSSQFFCTQVKKERPFIFIAPKSENTENAKLQDTINSIHESLERNKILDTECLRNLNDVQISEIIEILSQRLNEKETFNLCNSICKMDLSVGIQYVKIICTKLLLPKIIELKEPSRQLAAIIPIMINRFPDDIIKLIYIPMINADLQINLIMLAIINSYKGQAKIGLISDYLENVKEFKLWHLSILPVLINIKIDTSMKERLLTLLAENATVFAKDKNFSKFILSFIKINPPFSEEQKNHLNEIAAINETVFKNVIENILNNMYQHCDLWHLN